MSSSKKLPINFICSEHPEECTFDLKELKAGETITKTHREVHHLVFFLDGTTLVNCNLFEPTDYHAGDILFLPRMAECLFEAKTTARILIHEFNNLTCDSSSCILRELYIHSSKVADDTPYLTKVQAVPAVNVFIDSVINYLKDGKSDSALWYAKHQEAIHTLRLYYPLEVIQLFLRPLLHNSIPFENQVFMYAKYASTTDELAEMCGYSVSNFRRLFKKHFGVPVFHWLLEQKSKRIYIDLTLSDLPLKDIIKKYGFTSPSHLNKFCKQFFDATPSAIKKAARAKATA